MTSHKNRLEEILATVGAEKHIHYSLDRLKEALKSLGNPQESVYTFVIGGTNGKGTTALYLSAGLRQAGYRVATFLSPHLNCPTERFLYNLKPAQAQDLAGLAQGLLPTAQKYSLTYFEFLTLINFVWVKELQPDFLVLEVGLGGKLDATNVTRPIACAVTNIGLDHQQYLGPTKEKILQDKLQILPPEGLLFTGIEEPELLSQVSEYCDSIDAIYYYSKELRVVRLETHWQGQKITINDYPFSLNDPSIGTTKNAALALLMLRICFPKIPIESHQRAFSQVRNPGRFEVISQSPRIIFSGDHNLEGVESLLQTLNQLDPKRLFTLCAFSLDKPYSQMYSRLKEISSELLLTKTQRYDAVPDDYRQMGNYCEDPLQALGSLRSKLGPDDTLLVTGSLYLVGQLRPTV